MNRGIMFTMDAVFALIIVILLIAYLPQQLNAAEEDGHAFENLQSQALDKAIIGYYEESIGNEIISETARQGKCVVVYTIDPGNDLAAGEVIIRDSFCEEAG